MRTVWFHQMIVQCNQDFRMTSSRRGVSPRESLHDTIRRGCRGGTDREH